MNIQNLTCTSFIQNTKSVANSNKNCKNRDEISFKGHFGEEKFRNNYGWLVHETGFFRDLQTKIFVKDYILKNFADCESIKMLIGGCSTGEEAVTYSMLLDAIKTKLNIIGFDLSKKSIAEANSRKFLMQDVINKENGNVDNIWTLTDTYLWKDTNLILTDLELNNKRLFQEFLEPLDEKYKERKLSLRERFNHFLLKKLFKIENPILESRYYSLKPGMCDNITFTIGDITKLDKIKNSESANVLTFSNALYHLTTNLAGSFRYMRNDAEKTIEKLAKNSRKILVKDGIFVFGENESKQMVSQDIVTKVMEQCGFMPLNKTPEHTYNVYKVVK